MDRIIISEALAHKLQSKHSVSGDEVCYCHIITAYEPNAEEIRLYERHGKL